MVEALDKGNPRQHGAESGSGVYCLVPPSPTPDSLSPGQYPTPFGAKR